MKIVLFLNRDIEANIAYNLLKEVLLQHNVRIYYSDKVGDSNHKSDDLLILEYYEKDFFYYQLSKYFYENKIGTTFEFLDEQFSSFPIEKCTNVNSAEFIHAIQEFEPDLFISIRFGKIFKDPIIKIPKKGVINLHSAILPNYRGILGTLHAIKDGSNNIGCTLHSIPDCGIDSGEIIDIGKFAVNHNKSLFWHIIQLYPIGAKLIAKALKTLQDNETLESKKQTIEEGSYFSVPTQSDFDQIKKHGMSIVSKNDYLETITSFIATNLSEDEKISLSNYLETSTPTL